MSQSLMVIRRLVAGMTDDRMKAARGRQPMSRSAPAGQHRDERTAEEKRPEADRAVQRDPPRG